VPIQTDSRYRRADGEQGVENTVKGRSGLWREAAITIGRGLENIAERGRRKEGRQERSRELFFVDHLLSARNKHCRRASNMH